MNRRLYGFFVFLGVGAVAIVGYYFAAPYIDDRVERETSDSAAIRTTVVVGSDSWIGYFPFCSRELQRRLRQASIGLRCEDDAANYRERFDRLSRGEIQLAVSTVDAYVRLGGQSGFPGAIVAVLDESKGGDAIVAKRSAAGSLEAVKQAKDIKIGFTPNSPSEFLLKAVGVHFDVPQFRMLQGTSRVETDGSGAALKALLAGKVDVAALWEPDVSAALSDSRYVKLLGTESMNRLVVDVLIANRQFIRDNPGVLSQILHTYFQTLKGYRQDSQSLVRDVTQSLRIDESRANEMLQGVRWMSLADNAQEWFGVSDAAGNTQEGLIDSIEASLEVLNEVGDVKGNPLPDKDPLRILNRGYVTELVQKEVGKIQPAVPSAPIDFAPLPEGDWNKLREVGTLKVRPVQFQSGSAELTLEGKEELDKLALQLERYPSFRVVIKGHTTPQGDEDSNRALSLDRADAVRRYLSVTHAVDLDRVRVIGEGSSQPLPRLPNESDRAYRTRLSRVEVSFVREEL